MPIFGNTHMVSLGVSDDSTNDGVDSRHRRSRCLFDTSEFQLVVSNPRMIALTTPKVCLEGC